MNDMANVADGIRRPDRIAVLLLAVAVAVIPACKGEPPDAPSGTSPKYVATKILDGPDDEVIEVFVRVPDDTTSDEQRRMSSGPGGRKSSAVQDLDLKAEDVDDSYHYRIADLVYVRAKRGHLKTLVDEKKVSVRHVIHVPRLVFGPLPGAAEPHASEGPDVITGVDAVVVDSEEATIEDHLTQANVPGAWDLEVNGNGVVVGIIDTGAKANHHTFSSNYRGYDPDGLDHDYNWADFADEPSATPADAKGHGTKVTGVVVGGGCTSKYLDSTVGVAPGAQWIACRAAKELSGDMIGADQYFKCLEWMWSPTLDGEPNPTMSPDVIQFSGHFDEMDKDLAVEVEVMHQNLEDAGIVFVHSVGNIDVECPTLDLCDAFDAPPSSLDQALTVGAVDEEGRWFKSLCSAQATPSKPDLVAPGKSVRTAFRGPADEDGTCGGVSGTSLAAPIVSGVVALMLDANPCLKDHPAEVRALLRDAVGVKSTGPDCSDAVSPDRLFGNGEVNAESAVASAKAFNCPPDAEEVVD